MLKVNLSLMLFGIKCNVTGIRRILRLWKINIDKQEAFDYTFD